MTAYETVKASASQLTFEEKDRLVQELQDELDEADEPGAKDAWDDEIAQRIADIKSGAEVGIPLEEVLAELREKYP